ncbi:MAG: hypothetical protein K6A23_04985 [Butyrivibrio sp.]|nr:hypothetical protein [Butyrivibrio sp.]
MVIGSSIGFQPKYYEHGYWYKEDITGYKGILEYLISLVFKYPSAKSFSADERCMIDVKSGSCSKHFLDPNEVFISFQRVSKIAKPIV